MRPERNARVPRWAIALGGLLWSVLGHCEPILSTELDQAPSVIGWTNEYGQFSVDGFTSPHIYSRGGLVSYSTASSAYSLRIGSMGMTDGGQPLTDGQIPADIRIDAIIQGDGTPAGNLMGGSLVIIAGDIGVPALGVAPGATLLVARMIDDAATPGNFDTSFLFEVTFRNAAMPNFGDYLTYTNADANTWGFGPFFNDYEPWGHDVSHGNEQSFDIFDFRASHLVTPVPEPETYAMWLLGAGVLAFGCRRRHGLHRPALLLRGRRSGTGRAAGGGGSRARTPKF